MAEHTKGPWFVTKKFEVGPRSDADDQSNGMVIPLADVFGDNKEADASLIAAAPDFFEAASKLIAAFDELKSMTTAERIMTGRSDADLRKASDEAITGLRAAIAKAEARS